MDQNAEIPAGGGGQPGFATAGGKNLHGLDKELRLAPNYIAWSSGIIVLCRLWKSDL